MKIRLFFLSYGIDPCYRYLTAAEQFLSNTNSNGCIAIADSNPENGSFHGKEFTGHKGFETTHLPVILEKIGFKHIATR